MAKKTNKTIDLDKWINNVIAVHGYPSILLLRVDKAGGIHLIAGAGNEEQLRTVLEQKERDKGQRPSKAGPYHVG